ncbi:ABC transporter family substrate-binding protein [Millisia brevis]|uniref:ABC transporter family substrate-binding protein n=1 Tax=Millisia brevis TaxID=264148 RepID=UPI00082BDB49|nr:ABC transporter family substrate-binding protein [Millisia brevis]
MRIRSFAGGGDRPRRTARLLPLAALCATVLLAGCTSNPPPPIEVTPTDEPTTTTTVDQPALRGNTVVVAIDEVDQGFNPHLLSDWSPVAGAVASLVLPSPFRPVLDPQGETIWEPDPAIVVSADVTALEPFTITYQLRNEAQWSDSAPIAAEDFHYLWRQMISTPGTVDPAGYGLIDDVVASGGGKTVTVVMRQPYPAWRELFANLLPSHLIKDSPGGFVSGLANGIPVSGARFSVDSVDMGRDEVVLERNDRFWDEPAVPDQIVLRRAGDSASLAESMRSADAQVAQVGTNAVIRGQLAAIPGVITEVRPRPRVLGATMNVRSSHVSDPAVRRALWALLDRGLLESIAAGGTQVDYPARAQVLPPGSPDYAPTEPPPMPVEQAREILTAAGLLAPPRPPEPSPEPVPVTPTTPADSAATDTANTATTDGATTGAAPAPGPEVLTIAAATNDATATAVARTIGDQWRANGLTVEVDQLDPADMYDERLRTGDLDVLVGRSDGTDAPATILASRFGCLPLDSAPEDGEDSGPPEVLEPISGLCEADVTAVVARALSATTDVNEVIAEVEPRLWDLGVYYPIARDAAVVATGPDVTGIVPVGPVQTGVFASADRWLRVTQ